MMQRRAFITGIVSLLATPAIVKIESLMPISPIPRGGIIRVDLGTITMQEYIERVVEPALKEMANSVAEQVMFKQTYCWFEGTEFKVMARDEFEAKYGRG